MILVRLPAMLKRPEMTQELHIEAPVTTLDELIWELDRQYPGLATEIDDAIFNFAVNDALILHGVRRCALRDGDEVEIIPTISGGSAPTPGRARSAGGSLRNAGSDRRPRP